MLQGLRRRPPVVLAADHLDDGIAHRQPEPVRERGPHVEAGHAVESSRPVLDQQSDGVVAEQRRPPGAARSGGRAWSRPSRPSPPARAGSRVTTVTAPPRSKASTCSAAGPSARTGVYVVNSSGRSRRSRRARAVSACLALDCRTSDCSAASKSTGRRLSGSTRLEVAELAALVDVRHAGDGQRQQLGGERVRRTGGRQVGVEGLEDLPHPLVVEGGVDRGVHGALRRSSSGSVHVVRSPASRIAFSAYACSRSRDIGHAPYAACQSRLPKPGSGSGAASSRVTSVLSHSPGASASTAMRARTSSLRLVSWVDSVGHRVRPVPLPGGHRVVELGDRRREDRWVAADLVERGEPGVPVERAVLDPLGHHHPGGLLEPQRGRLGRVGQDRLQRVERGQQVGTPGARAGERATSRCSTPRGR